MPDERLLGAAALGGAGGDSRPGFRLYVWYRVWQVFLASEGGCSAGHDAPGINPGATAKPQEIVPCQKSVPYALAFEI